MKKIALLSGILIIVASVQGQPSFTYQGRLRTGGSSANGPYDLEFRLYGTPTSGDQIGATVARDAVLISNGLFTLSLDFGAGIFDGSARWLQIGVKSNAVAGPFTMLIPRQQITPAPEATFAQAAGRLASTTGPLEFRVNNAMAMRYEPSGGTPNIIGGYEGNSVISGAIGVTIGGGGQISEANSIGGDFGTISGGRLNFISSSGTDGTIAGGTGNIITLGWTCTIGGGEANRLGRGTPIGFATIGGGKQNEIAGASTASTISGGESNRVGYGCSGCTIAGGEGNEIGWEFRGGTISGGLNNRIHGVCRAAVIGGGENNEIGNAGEYATIPGGSDNHAVRYAFAAGTRAKAMNSGSFVWADRSGGDIASTNENSVTMRASGGYRLFSDPDATIGAYLASNSGSWISMSDRNAKQDFEAVQPREVLEKVAALPVQRWSYKAQGTGVRHIGPTAQDFKSAFEVGESDTGIATVDADGVALAAIQGLNQKVEEQNAEIRELRAALKAIQTELVEVKRDRGLR